MRPNQYHADTNLTCQPEQVHTIGRSSAKRIQQADTVEEALKCLALADTVEEAMCAAGYRRNTAAIRPANEARFEARWRLGQLLTKVERAHGGDRRSSSRAGTLKSYLHGIGLNKNRANECERISAIPRDKLRKAFEETEREGVLNTVESMFLFARPFLKIKVRIQTPKENGPRPAGGSGGCGGSGASSRRTLLREWGQRRARWRGSSNGALAD
jgi:hypothetical protein